MKIGVCTLAIGDEYREAVKYAMRTLDEYCTKHGYFLHRETESYDEREPMWNKILLLQKYVNTYDYLVWIDADIQINNMDIKLESFIFDYMGSKDIMMSEDSGGELNTGVWFFRNCELSSRMLKLVYELPMLAGNFHEQGVFETLYRKNLFNLKERCRILSEVEQTVFNSSFYAYKPGGWCIHYLGIKAPSRLTEVMNLHYPWTLDNETLAEKAQRDAIAAQHVSQMRTPCATRYAAPVLPKIKIGICTLLIGEKYANKTVKYGHKSIQMYCEANGYDLIVGKESLCTDRTPHWSKLPLVLTHLKNYDYLVWMDADIIIMNEKIKLEDLMREHMGMRDIMACRDVSEHINTGVVFVKNTEFSHALLELQYSLPELEYCGCYDQDVFNKLYNDNIINMQEKTTILTSLNQTLFNCSVGCFYGDMFLIHFYSLSSGGLEKAFGDFYKYQKDDEPYEQYLARVGWLKDAYKITV